MDDVAEPAEEGEDGVTPVVVRVRKVRRGLVLGSCGAVAGTYVVDGVAQSEFCFCFPFNLYTTQRTNG